MCRVWGGTLVNGIKLHFLQHLAPVSKVIFGTGLLDKLAGLVYLDVSTSNDFDLSNTLHSLHMRAGDVAASDEADPKGLRSGHSSCLRTGMWVVRRLFTNTRCDSFPWGIRPW